MMKIRRLISLLSLLGLLLLPVSCRRGGALPGYPDGTRPELSLSIFVSGTSIGTKAPDPVEQDYIAASAQERKIHSVRIWVYLSQAFQSYPANMLLGYLEPDTDTYNFAGGNAIRLTTPLDENFALAAALADDASKPRVRLYAIVNGEAAGVDDSFLSGNGISHWNEVTPAMLDGVVLSGDEFGTSVLTTSVPSEGLPMAGFMENVPITGAFPVLTIPTVKVTRLVSRIRFIFCQIADGLSPADNFSITGISLSGSVGASEKAFTTSRWSSSYDRLGTNEFDATGSSALDLNYTAAADLPSSLALNPAPSSYSYANFPGDPQGWEDKLDQGLASGELTEWKRIYLREGGAAFSGTLRYRIDGGEEKSASFSLAAGGFTRNHCWNIYAYFIGGKLYIAPELIPWEAGHDVFDYATEGATELLWVKYLRHQPNGDSWDWGQTWVACAYGTAQGTDLPSRTPELSLDMNHGYTCWLQVDNPNFSLITMSGTASSPVFTNHGQKVVIPPERQIVTFFVVPDNTQDALDDPYANVTVTVVRTDGMPPYNVPFNHDLPGAEDHTSIRYKNVGSAAYMANANNEKNSARIQLEDDGVTPRQYWIESKE